MLRISPDEIRKSFEPKGTVVVVVRPQTKIEGMGQSLPMPSPACQKKTVGTPVEGDTRFLVRGDEFCDQLNVTRAPGDQVGEFNGEGERAYAIYTPMVLPETASSIAVRWQGRPPSLRQTKLCLFNHGAREWDCFEGPSDSVLTVNTFDPYRSGEEVVTITVAIEVSASEKGTLFGLLIGGGERRGLGLRSAFCPIPESGGSENGGMGKKPKAPAVKWPPKIDLSMECPPVSNQGQLPSCTAHAAAGGLGCALIAASKGSGIEPSQLPGLDSLVHYLRTGLAMPDSRCADGRFMQPMMFAIQSPGIPLRTDVSLATSGDWPEWPSCVAQAQAGPPWTDSKSIPLFTTSWPLRSIEAIKEELCQRHPVIFGMAIDETFHQVSHEQVVYDTLITDLTNIGGHAMAIVGYDDSRQQFLVRNSWGPGWGAGGHVWISYRVFEHQLKYGWMEAFGFALDSKAYFAAAGVSLKEIADRSSTAKLFFDVNASETNDRPAQFVALVDLLRKNHQQVRAITITGATDYLGSEHANEALGFKRARFLRDRLRKLLGEDIFGQLIIEPNSLGERHASANRPDDPRRRTDRYAELQIIWNSNHCGG